MNRINPLYILALLFVLLFYSFSLVNTKEKEFLGKNTEYNNLVVKAKEYKSLKTNNINKNRVISIINSITTDSRFKKAKIRSNKSKNSINLNIQTSDFKILNKFINRILNEKLSILKLEIKADKINLEIGIS